MPDRSLVASEVMRGIRSNTMSAPGKDQAIARNSLRTWSGPKHMSRPCAPIKTPDPGSIKFTHRSSRALKDRCLNRSLVCASREQISLRGRSMDSQRMDPLSTRYACVSTSCDTRRGQLGGWTKFPIKVVINSIMDSHRFRVFDEAAGAVGFAFSLVKRPKHRFPARRATSDATGRLSFPGTRVVSPFVTGLKGIFQAHSRTSPYG